MSDAGNAREGLTKKISSGWSTSIESCDRSSKGDDALLYSAKDSKSVSNGVYSVSLVSMSVCRMSWVG